MIAVYDQATAGTLVCSHIQRHHLPMMAPAAILTRVGRIDCNVFPASLFRFAG